MIIGRGALRIEWEKTIFQSLHKSYVLSESFWITFESIIAASTNHVFIQASAKRKKRLEHYDDQAA